MDGTLYSLDDVVTMNYQMQLDFYSVYTGKDKNQVIKEFEANNIYPVMTEKSKSATEFFVGSGISSKEWNTYREEHFDVSAINKKTVVSSEVIYRFAEIATLVLLSSNSLYNIQKILKHINIDACVFKDILCSDHKYGNESFKKIDEMKYISSKYDIEPKNILSVGDRYKTDIEPILEIGGMGVVINGPQDLYGVLNAIIIGKWSNIRLYGA